MSQYQHGYAPGALLRRFAELEQSEAGKYLQPVFARVREAQERCRRLWHTGAQVLYEPRICEFF